MFCSQLTLSKFCHCTVQRHIPLKLGWNEFPDYSAPINLDYIGPTFMFLGFLPASLTAQGNEEGLQVSNVWWLTNKDCNHRLVTTGAESSFLWIRTSFNEILTLLWAQSSPSQITRWVLFVFTAGRNARIASALLATAIPSVCLSVCPSVRLSHARIVSKRRHLARCSLHCQIAKCV